MAMTNGVENCYVFKSRLQEYAQKAGIATPEYITSKDGPSHEPVFRSTVVVNNVRYDSLPGFFNRKAAEQSAAEIALMEIFKSAPQGESIPAVHETGLCKNLLQEYAQKMNFAIPSYKCNKQANGSAPFICTVEVGGIQYTGAAARTKREAEIKAARTALLAIQASNQSETGANGTSQYIVVPGKKKVKEPEKATEPKPLKPKKHGFKKKCRKNSFMKIHESETTRLEITDGGILGTEDSSDVILRESLPLTDIGQAAGVREFSDNRGMDAVALCQEGNGFCQDAHQAVFDPPSSNASLV